LKVAVALHFFSYTFTLIHQTLTITSPMEGTITEHTWRRKEYAKTAMSEMRAA